MSRDRRLSSCVCEDAYASGVGMAGYGDSRDESDAVVFESVKLQPRAQPGALRGDALRYVRYRGIGSGDFERFRVLNERDADISNITVPQINDGLRMTLHMLARREARFIHTMAPEMKVVWSRNKPSYNVAMLFLCMRGGYEVLAPQSRFVREPGMTLILPGAEPIEYRMMQPVNEIVQIVLNPRLFMDILPGFPACASAAQTLPALDQRVLSPLMEYVASSCVISSQHPAAAEDVGLAMYATARNVLLTTFGQLAHAKSSLYTQAMEYILRHQTDPGLILAHVARYCGVASRTMQQVFRDEGTSFTRMLQQTRAEAALRLRGDHPSLTLSQIAEQCGFGSLSSLSRALRAADKAMDAR